MGIVSLVLCRTFCRTFCPGPLKTRAVSIIVIELEMTVEERLLVEVTLLFVLVPTKRQMELCYEKSCIDSLL